MNFFLIFEGIDGSGKSTASKNLNQALIHRGMDSILFQEPTRYPTGLRLREFLSGNLELTPDEELQLFIEDRRESVKRNILPNLKNNRIVILDRYYYSTAAYQANTHRSPETILKANLEENFPEPDFILYLDIKPSEALKRIQDTRIHQDRFETIDALEKISANYERILPKHTIRINAVMEPEKITEEIMKYLPV